MLKFTKHILKELNNLYSKSEIDFLKKIVLEHVTNASFTQLFLNKRKLTPTEQSTAKEIVQKLKNKVPIQYILRKADFYNSTFYVDENVLIPRPETEELVEWIINDNRPKSNLSILDIGTGSGCIAISLAKHLKNAKVYALDKHPKALEIKEKNAKENNLEIPTISHDILSKVKIAQQWDIIVSNPPYIPEIEKNSMDKIVTDNEPQTALFVPNDNPLLFYEKIAEFSLTHLNAKGTLYFEIHQDFGKEIVKMLDNKGFLKIELKQDISKNDRMIRASI